VFVERLWRSVKYEEVYLHAYASLAEARAGLGRYLNFYNGRPPPRTKLTLSRNRCWRPPEKFRHRFWAARKEGVARLERGPDTGILQPNPAELPLIENEPVFRQSQPTLYKA